MTDRDYAEKALKHLCIGSQLDGLGFFGIQVKLWNLGTKNGDEEIEEITINIEADFCILDSISQAKMIHTVNFPEVDVTESLKMLCELREKIVTDVMLSSHNHLIVQFETGKVLIVSGYDEMYESWQVGSSTHTWLVVACPGAEVCLWAPESWIEEIDREAEETEGE